MFNPAKSSILKSYKEGGNIYQFYGENSALYIAAIGLPGHPGLDIAMSEGTPILAAHDGTVFHVKSDPTGFGEYVQVIGNNKGDDTYFCTTYGHCRNINVKVGDVVKAEDQLAEMSNTGFVISGGSPYWGNAPAGKGVHLHFGIRIYSSPVPITLLTGFTVVDGDKPMKGWVDPLLYLTNKNMYELFRDPNKISEVYAVNGTVKRHISNLFALRRGKGDLWNYGTEADIVPFTDYAKWNVMTELEEIALLPNDNMV